jgi:hypothetical protein
LINMTHYKHRFKIVRKLAPKVYLCKIFNAKTNRKSLS